MHSAVKSLFRCCKIVLLVIIVLALMIVAVCWLALGTDTGFARVSHTLKDRIPGLEFSETSGNLGSGLTTDYISYENNSVAIKAQGIESSWQISCLLRRKYCLNNVQIDQLDMALFAADATATAEPSTGPISLPTIALPVDFNVEKILIKQLNFQPPGDAPVQVINDILLSGHTTDDTVFLDELAANYKDYSASVSGSVTLSGDYPLELQAKLEAKDILPSEVIEGEGDQSAVLTLALSNSLRDLAVDATLSGAVDAKLVGTVQPLENDLPISAELISEELGWPITSKSIVIANNTSVTLDGTLNDYDLSIATQVQGEQVPTTQIALNGLVNQERLSLPEIQVNTLGGEARAEANLSWQDICLLYTSPSPRDS